MNLEAPRPSYEERRLAQFESGAPPIPPKTRVGRIRVAWTNCEPKDATLSAGRKPSWYRTEEAANAANELFKAARGYAEQISYCEVCRGWHLRHVYAADICRCTVQTPVQEPTIVPEQTAIPAPLAVPDAREVPNPQPAAPAPTQASTFAEWLENARTLAKTGKCLSWDIGDHILYGKRTFGDNAIPAALKTTGWTRGYISRVATVCERFPVEQRLPELSFYVYQRLQPFPPEITNKLLPMAAAQKIGARRLYRKACELAGEDPADRVKGLQSTVPIPTSLYGKLHDRAHGGRVSALVQEILEEWLVGAPVERKVSGPRTHEWKERVLAS
jgi:hypothetical protein